MRRFLTIFLCCILLSACSTTRILAPGEYRLARNEIKVDDKRFSTNELTPYVRQQANPYFLFGWNPFLSIYNWSDGSDKPFSRFCRKVGTAPVVYNRDLVSASEENICNHLKYLGYYNSVVKAEEIPSGRIMKVVYNVTLGNRIPITSVRYDIPSGGDFEKSFYSDTASVLVRPGMYLSEQLLEKESARSAENMRNLGYYGFNKSNYSFVADTLEKPGSALLDYCVREYARGADPDRYVPVRKYDFGDVTISIDKNLPFRESVLKRLNAITPGTVYNDDDVDKTYSRFSSLQVFNSVNIRTTPTDSSTVNCDISLSGAKLKGLKVNLESSVTATGLIGISPQLSFYHKNLFHGGEWFNLGFSGAFQFKPKDRLSSNEFGITTSISIPQLLLIPDTKYKSPAIPRTEFKLSYNFQSRPEFTRHVVSASMGYSGRFKDKLFFQAYPLQLSYVRLEDISEEFQKVLKENPYLSYSYSDHFDAGIGGTLLYTTNADIVPKTSYRYVRMNFDASGNLLSLFRNLMPGTESGQALIAGAPFSQYVRGDFNLGNTFIFGRKNGQALAARLSVGVGYAYGNSGSLPYEKQFFVGGASSMRGWQARSVGPGFAKPNGFTLLPSQTGDVKLEADLEYRARLFWKIEGALFAETGNVWALPAYGIPQTMDQGNIFHFNNFYKSLAADWGAGVRLNLDFIVVRVDFGIKVHDPSKDEGDRWRGPDKWFRNDGFAFHFGVGYPF